MLSRAALQPPRTRWDGPQPGLFEQTDAAHRYIFSPKHGRISAVICYGEQGVPVCRVSYKNSSPEQVIPHKLFNWSGTGFEFAGNVSGAGEILGAPFSRTMIDIYGEERVMPAGQDFFVTPAGFVVQLLGRAGFFHSQKTEYVGRLTCFVPEQPFQFISPSGVQTLAPHENGALTNSAGVVFSVGRNMRVIGKLLPYKVPAERSHRHIQFSNNDFFVSRFDGEIFARTLNPDHKVILDGALPQISGRHPFLHRETAQLEHPEGNQDGEVALRALEHAAFQFALIIRALKTPHGQQPQNHALLIAAHAALETKLWSAAEEFEKIIGAPARSVINPEFVRIWIDGAVQNPQRALRALLDHVYAN